MMIDEQSLIPRDPDDLMIEARRVNVFHSHCHTAMYVKLFYLHIK